jgi:hypothetical protein
MGASKQKTASWLVSQGVDIPEDIFELTEEEKQEKAEMNPFNNNGGDDEKLPFAKNSNLYDSRKPEKKDTSEYKSGSDAKNTKND